MAPNLQLSMQAPHLMHLVGSMTYGCLITPLIAPTGQTRAQAEQPLHLSGMIVNCEQLLAVAPAGQRFS